MNIELEVYHYESGKCKYTKLSSFSNSLSSIIESHKIFIKEIEKDKHLNKQVKIYLNVAPNMRLCVHILYEDEKIKYLHRYLALIACCLKICNINYSLIVNKNIRITDEIVLAENLYIFETIVTLDREFWLNTYKANRKINILIPNSTDTGVNIIY